VSHVVSNMRVQLEMSMKWMMFVFCMRFHTKIEIQIFPTGRL